MNIVTKSWGRPACVSIGWLPGRRGSRYGATDAPRPTPRLVCLDPLEGSWKGTVLPDLPGLYRIKRDGQENLDYIGQTSEGRMTLHRRVGMLRGVYEDEMPYRDPHTAAPALWSFRFLDGRTFLVSVAPVEGSTPWRKGLECVAISHHRQTYGRSPTVNFGRMPLGYRMSSGNNARLVKSGRRIRGGPTDVSDPSHKPGISPRAPFAGDPHDPDWCGHLWSAWHSLANARHEIPPNTNGLYRIRRTDMLGLIYIGQGVVSARLSTHVRKVGRPMERQADLFSGPLECSWVLNEAWLPHHRLELENDLIAAYLLETGEIPTAQFLG